MPDCYELVIVGGCLFVEDIHNCEREYLFTPVPIDPAKEENE
jgi:hypothetical protein